MYFQFFNNFDQALAAELPEDATTLTLDGGVDQLSIINASAEQAVALTLVRLDGGQEVHREIVYATATDSASNALTVLRGREGTTPLPGGWPSGTAVEMRLTAGMMSGLAQGSNVQNPAAIEVISLGPESAAVADYAVAIGKGAQATSPHSMALGGEGELTAYDGSVTTHSAPGAHAALAVAIGADSGAYGVGAMGLAGGQAYGDYSMALAGGSAQAEHAVAVGENAYVSGAHALAVGREAAAYSTDAVALGYGAYAYGDNSFSVGTGSNAGAPNASAFGYQASAGAPDSLALGVEAQTYGEGATAVGRKAQATAKEAFAAGQGAQGHAEAAVAVGRNAIATSLGALAVGKDTAAHASGAVAIGDGAQSTVPGGLALNALSYLPATPNHPEGVTTPASTRQGAAQVIIATDVLDLTDGSAAVTLAMPSGTMLFIDAIDVVIVGSDTAGGSPEITIGPDDVTPAAYLSSTPVGKTAMGGRESHAPLVADGATSLRVATAVAGTGTIYQAKVVFCGYVMEV